MRSESPDNPVRPSQRRTTCFVDFHCDGLDALRSREVLRSVTLVRLDDLAGRELHIAVTWVYDLPIVDHREHREAAAIPCTSDDEFAASHIVVRGMGCGASSGLVVAGGHLCAVILVDCEGESAGGIGGIADSLEVLNGPERAGDHH